MVADQLFDLAGIRHGRVIILAAPLAIVGDQPLGGRDDLRCRAIIAVQDVNLRSVFLGMRYGIPLMLKSGGGSIVNTASMAAMVAFPNMAAYCAAKGGVKQLTKTAAVEYASKGRRANAICPGTIKTAITAALSGLRSLAGRPVVNLASPPSAGLERGLAE